VNDEVSLVRFRLHDGCQIQETIGTPGCYQPSEPMISRRCPEFLGIFWRCCCCVGEPSISAANHSRRIAISTNNIATGMVRDGHEYAFNSPKYVFSLNRKRFLSRALAAEPQLPHETRPSTPAETPPPSLSCYDLPSLTCSLPRSSAPSHRCKKSGRLRPGRQA
jgi:hypothetical protein